MSLKIFVYKLNVYDDDKPEEDKNKSSKFFEWWRVEDVRKLVEQLRVRIEEVYVMFILYLTIRS